jgi:hypothetical protein
MKMRNIALVTGTLACMLSVSALAQGSKDWVEIKNPDELRAPYSNMTFNGKAPDGSSFVSYYSADGRGLLISYGHRTLRTWKVKGDEVCVTASTGTNCFRFLRNKANPNEIAGRQVTGGWMFWATVKDGVPNF